MNKQLYIANHIPTEEKVTIKVLNKIQLLSEPENLKKTEREILILKKMFHKNIIKLFEIIETSQKNIFSYGTL